MSRTVDVAIGRSPDDNRRGELPVIDDLTVGFDDNVGHRCRTRPPVSREINRALSAIIELCAPRPIDFHRQGPLQHRMNATPHRGQAFEPLFGPRSVNL